MKVDNDVARLADGEGRVLLAHRADATGGAVFSPRHHRGHRPVDATPLQRRLSEICARAEEILGINIEELDLAGQPSPAKAAVGLPVARAGRTAAAREAARHSPATPGGRPPMDIQNANYTPFGIS
ncbi:hypothetical protein [Streptomyces sp. DB-54]